MVFGVTKQNAQLFVVIAFALGFFALMYVPMTQWTFVIDWVVQTPLIIILGQSVFFLMAVSILTVFLIMIRELIA